MSGERIFDVLLDNFQRAAAHLGARYKSGLSLSEDIERWTEEVAAARMAIKAHVASVIKMALGVKSDLRAEE